jgi:hypothetical protein
MVFPLVTLSFNVIKKNENWEGFMVEEEGGGSSLAGAGWRGRAAANVAGWMTRGAAGPLPTATNLGRWSPAAAP